jgi:formamidopyrimidine-DNA glycosylase
VPELPDVVIYVESLRAHILNQRLERIHLFSPFVLRSVDPPLDAVAGEQVRDVDRLGKRIVVGFSADIFLVIHLMIAGRLRWRSADNQERPKAKGARQIPKKIILAQFEFEPGSLLLTEASSTKRASIQLVRGRESLAALDRGGVEPLGSSYEDFHEALVRENHTLKRSLTDPRLFSGIGNAYSDEILHAARISPLRLTRSLSEEEARRLHEATRTTLTMWVDRLRAQSAGAFPEKVTAFHEEMAVHGRFGQPCPVCASPVQRIVYAENECNYCARCQTGGRLLADRSLSRLLKDDWPRSIDDL